MNRRMLLACLIAIALSSLALAAVGCGGSDDRGPGSCAESSNVPAPPSSDPIADGTLTVGSAIPFPPFEDGSKGDYTGFDIDLVNAIGKELDLDVTYEATDFDTIFCDLSRGEFDMVASATAITPQRLKLVAFSDPYYEAQQALLMPAGSDIADSSDPSEKAIGVQAGSAGEAYVDKRTDAVVVHRFAEAAETISALLGGQVDAVVIDLPVAHDAVKTTGTGLQIAGIPSRELYGLSVAKGNAPLLRAVDGALRKLKDDGTLTRLYRRYFGIGPPRSILLNGRRP